MRLGTNPFALLDEDPNSSGEIRIREEPKKAPGANKQKKDTSAGAAKPELNTKAAQVFRERNELSAQERRARNQKKKQKKNQKKAIGEKVATTGVKAVGTAAPAGSKPALTLAELEKIEKELNQKRQQQINEYISTVGSVLDGSAFYFEMEPSKYPQLFKDDLKELFKNAPFKAISQVMASKAFLDLFVASLPPHLKPSPLPSLPPNQRVERKLTRQDFALHLLALVSTPTFSKNNKNIEDAASLVDGFLEGAFGVVLSEEVESSLSSGRIGSAGGVLQTQASLFDFVKTPPQDKKKSKPGKGKAAAAKGKPAESPKPTATATTTTTTEAPPTTETTTEPTTVVVNDFDITDPTSQLTENLKNELSSRADLLAQRIGFNSRPVQIKTPIFRNVEKNFGGGAGRGRGAGRGKGAAPAQGPAQEAPAVEPPGFLWNGVGADYCYVVYNANNKLQFLFTTGGKPKNN